jgi:signal transduction histidine kinase
MAHYGNRYQLGLTLLTGFFLVAAVFAVLLYALTPETPATRGPLLLAAFIAILLGSLVCILLFLRWMLRPYRQLVGEAEKASADSSPHKDEAEFVLETFQSVLAQLQEQRKALEELSAQAAQRADSAEKFSERIVASVPSGLIAFDGTGRSMVVNAPGRALLELDGDAVGQPVSTILRNFPQLAEMVAGCLQSGRIYRREEVQTQTSGHQLRRVGATVAPIDLAPGETGRGALCLLTDITEVTNLREQVALKNKLESLGEMSAGLAHEFKNSIATLHGYVQLLQGLDLDQRARGTTTSLLNEVRNLSDMVTSFLNFARPQPLQFEEVNISELLAECCVELGPLFAERRVKLAADYSDRSPIVIGADERMLRQALLNLIRNAAEAIPESADARRVEVVARAEHDQSGKDWAVIEIEDTGQGVPESDLQRIFIPFFTTKAAGHGVGLALAYRVVTQHGGTLTAANSQTGGAIFTVRLPV